MFNSIQEQPSSNPPYREQHNRLLRFPDVRERVGLCRSQIYSLIAQDRFPPPIKLGARASAWSELEISEWIDERIAQSRQ